MDVELVPLRDLKPHPKNYREHPEDQIDHIVESIKRNGFYRNIVVARDGTILAGHGVVKAADRMGLDQIPVFRLDVNPDDPVAIKVLIGDNEIPNLGMKNDRALTDMLKSLKIEDGEDLLGTGLDEMMLANLVFVTRPAEEIADFDEAAHWVGMPEYEESQNFPQLIVSFKTEEDRERFVAFSGVGVMKRSKKWSAWWPPRSRDDSVSVRFEG